MDKIDFVRKHYSDQIQALNWLIEERFGVLPKEGHSLLRFGGGTALAMYYFQHRLSFDIDLFAVDQQVLDFFRPKTWLEESRFFNTEEYTDQNNHVGFLTNNGIKVDILTSSSYSNGLLDQTKNYFPIDIVVESIEDIIAKKIVFRNMQNKTRDIIDIAIALDHNPALFSGLLLNSYVEKEHLETLKRSVYEIDRARYEAEFAIVEPFDNFKNIASNAPEIIIAKLDTLLTSNKALKEDLFDLGHHDEIKMSLKFKP